MAGAGKQVRLRVLGDVDLATPTLQRMRTRLGGPATARDRAGAIVRLDDGPPTILLYEEGGAAHLWAGEGTVRRVDRERVRPHDEPAPHDVLAIAVELRTFASLRAGTRVTFGGPGGEAAEGTLVERCRLGGLVARDDGSVLGVGFRRLRAVAVGS